jgi:hypothetical protein
MRRIGAGVSDAAALSTIRFGTFLGISHLFEQHLLAYHGHVTCSDNMSQAEWCPCHVVGLWK